MTPKVNAEILATTVNLLAWGGGCYRAGSEYMNRVVGLRLIPRSSSSVVARWVVLLSDAT